jgi:hypothetical protein
MSRVTQTDEYLIIDGEKAEYKLGKDELPCDTCGTVPTGFDYREEFAPNDPDCPVDTPVPVMSLGVTCPACGETALHVMY